MPNTKFARPNKKIKTIVRQAPDDVEDLTSLPIAKIKKSPDIELHDDLIGMIEEKPEVDPLLADEETDETAAEDAVLDEEEINPFGDKWEV